MCLFRSLVEFHTRLRARFGTASRFSPPLAVPWSLQETGKRLRLRDFSEHPFISHCVPRDQDERQRKHKLSQPLF